MIVIGGIVLAIVILAIVIWMLLTRKLREKYAALWLVLGVVVLILGLFPQLLLGLTSALGVQLPVNLLFAMAIVLLLGVALHLSWELSQAEEEIRRTAEEIAILHSRVDVLEEELEHLRQTRNTAASDPSRGASGDDRQA